MLQLREELSAHINTHMKKRCDYTMEDLILLDKYAAFWEDKYDSTYDYNFYILYRLKDQHLKQIMLKYKLHHDLIINNPSLLIVFCQMSIITKYAIDEQLILSKFILENIRDIYIYNICFTLLDYIISLCDYDLMSWMKYKKSVLNRCVNISNSQFNAARYVNKYFKKYIKPMIIYDRSLRNKWILSCSAMMS